MPLGQIIAGNTIGSSVRWRGLDDGELMDPEGVRFWWTPPGGTTQERVYAENEPQIEKISVGHYRTFLLLDAEGVWHLSWVAGSDPNQRKIELAVKVSKARVAPPEEVDG
jgi:hypothetical protein